MLAIVKLVTCVISPPTLLDHVSFNFPSRAPSQCVTLRLQYCPTNYHFVSNVHLQMKITTTMNPFFGPYSVIKENTLIR